MIFAWKSFLLLAITNKIREASASCAAIGASCNEDCECCGYDQAGPQVSCERRNKILGYRCYQNGQIGDACLSNDQCVSQYCHNSVCSFKPNPPKKIAEFCPLEINSVAMLRVFVSRTAHTYLSQRKLIFYFFWKQIFQ